jgi:hypothetical protein
MAASEIDRIVCYNRPNGEILSGSAAIVRGSSRFGLPHVTSIGPRFRGYRQWHQPDRMIINQTSITFVEPVGGDSKVAQLIAESKR